MGFADVIRKRVEAEMEQPEGDNPFRKVLDELAEGLTSPDVCARITEGAGARLFLTLWPRTRPTSRHLLLAFSLSDKDIRVHTDPVQLIQDPKKLEGSLEAFVSLPSFIDSLEALTRLSPFETGVAVARPPASAQFWAVRTVLASVRNR